MFNILLANFIWIIHFIIFLLIILIPFIPNITIYKVLYIIYIPLLWIHWKINTGHCSLTLVENWLRGNPNIYEQGGFITRIIKPIYTFPDSFNLKYMEIFIWIISILLWIYVIYQVRYKLIEFLNVIKKYII